MLINPGRTDQGRERGRDDNRFRTSQEAKPKDTYYRPEYGWVMSNAMVKEEQGVKAQYDKATSDTETQIASNESAYAQSLVDGRKQINDAYSEAAKKNNVQLVPVRVVNGNSIEATYNLPKATVDQMNKDSFNKGKGSYVGNYVDNGAYYNVDVRVTGTGGKRGQELHDSLRNATSDYEKSVAAAKKNLEKEKAASLKSFETTSAANYAGAKKVWDAELAQVRSAYGNRVATGKAQYEESKQKYSDSITGVDMGLLESPTNQVNPNAKGAK